ncbi:MAG: MFS transporter [Clostridia bacterium]|nr:MFS transporter [Clostridia bacterium]
MEETSNQFLGQEPVGRLMRKYALPCIISLLVGALYNIVDQIFIANASYLGSYGNAANTVVFPLTVIALAVAVMIGDGCCAFVSLNLGKGESGSARKSVGNSVIMTVIGGLVLCAVYLIFSDSIIAMFGGTVNPETFGYSKEYFFYISLGVPFYMFGQAMNPVVRADGSPGFAMISTLAGAAVNMMFDPIFIFGFKWGMTGTAVATVIGQIVTAVLTIWYLLNMKTIRPAKSDFRLNASVSVKTLSLGLATMSTIVGIPGAIVSPISYSYVTWARRKFSTKTLWIFGSHISDFLMIGVFLIGSINKNYKKLSVMIPAFMLRETIWMFFWGIRSVIPEEMRNESIDYGEWKNGYRNEGLTGVAKELPRKLINTFGATVKTIILDRVGYVEGAGFGGQTEKTEYSLFWMCTILPVITGILSIIPKCFYNLSGEKRDTMYRELHERRKLREEQYDAKLGESEQEPAAVQ